MKKQPIKSLRLVRTTIKTLAVKTNVQAGKVHVGPSVPVN